MPCKKIFLSGCYILCIFFVIAQNQVSTYAGTGTAGFSNGRIDTCTLSHPWGICLDKNNNLYMADAGNNCIRKINTTTGLITTIAGTGIAGYKDGTGDSALFSTPIDICADDTGNIYVTDFNNQCVRKISVNGRVSTIAGSRIQAFGYVDGIADSALFQYPRGICRDNAGNLYIGDSWNHRIRKIDVTGNVTTWAGGGITGVGTNGDLLDAPDTSARFNVPCGLSVDSAGNIYVADAYNHRIRKIDVNRTVTTIAGSGPTGKLNGGFADGDTSVAQFNTPTELYTDISSSKIYVADLYNYRIRLINLSTDSVSTFAGNGTEGYFDGPDSAAEFDLPRGVVLDTSGKKLFVADYNDNVIRVIDINTGNVSAVIQLSNNNSLSVYPNPFNNELKVSMPCGEKLLQIFDADGKQLNEWQTAGINITLDVSSLAAGNYILKYTSAGQTPVSRSIMKVLR